MTGREYREVQQMVGRARRAVSLLKGRMFVSHPAVTEADADMEAVDQALRAFSDGQVHTARTRQALEILRSDALMRLDYATRQLAHDGIEHLDELKAYLTELKAEAEADAAVYMELLS